MKIRPHSFAHSRCTLFTHGTNPGRAALNRINVCTVICGGHEREKEKQSKTLRETGRQKGVISAQ